MTEELIHELLRRQDTFSEQLGALARNQEAFAEEHRELVEFLGRKFDRIDRRFVKLEVGLEGVRDEVRILAEGIAGTNQRLDRFQERLEHLEAG
jgi:predicted  nucleic acid-binding Zn-ribbon protein